MKRSAGVFAVLMLVWFTGCARDADRVTPEDLTDFATRYAAAWSSQDPASVAAFFAEDGALKITDGEPSVGRAALTATAQTFMTQLPDMVVVLDSLGHDGDRATFHWTLTGSNSGPGGNGNPIHVSGFEEWLFGPDGLIAHSQGHMDTSEYQRQLETDAPAAEHIVARVATAMMGSEAIDDLKTLRTRMDYPDHDYLVVTELRRPNRMRTEGVGNYVLVFDGERGAFLERPPAEDGTPQGPELIDAKYTRDLELDIAFVFPAFFDYPSEYLGRDVVEGVEAHELGVTLPSGIRTTYFVDAKSWLPIKVLADVTVDGTEYHPGRILHDYEEWEGMMYPRAITYWWLPDNVETAAVDLVEVNVPLGDDRFAIPADIQ